MNEYLECQIGVLSSHITAAIRPMRRWRPSSRLHLAAAMVAAASTLSAANLTEMHGRVKREVPASRVTAQSVASTASTTFNADQGPGPGLIGPGPGCNLLPAPASIGAAVNLSYFGPPPSESNPSLVGPVQLLKSGTIDAAKDTITLPLYQGSMAGSQERHHGSGAIYYRPLNEIPTFCF